MKKKTTMPEIGTKEFNETADSIFGGSVGKKQTAVEWLIEQLKEQGKTDLVKWPEFEAAKQMEKEQIIDAHLDGQSLVSCKDEYAEQYYNETYKQD